MSGLHATPLPDRMVKRRSHAAMLEKRQRATEEETTTRRAAATTRTTARDDDNTRTTARTTAANTSARGAAASSATTPAGRSSAASSAARGVSTPSVAGTTPSVTVPNPAASASSSAAAAKSGSSNTGVIVAVVVVAVLLLAAMAAFVIFRKKKNRKAAALASRAEKAKSEEMFGHGPGDMAAVADYRNRVGANDPYGNPIAPKGGFGSTPYSPNEKGSRRSWEQSDDGRSYGNHSEVGLVGAAAFPGKGRHPSSQPSDNSYGSEPYSPPPPPVPSIDPAIAAMQAVGVNQNGPPTRAEGSVFIVKRMFEPSLSDELIIYPGDRVRILNMYDDGWCLAENLTSAAPSQAPPRGVCPRDCIDNAPLSAAELASSPTSAAGGANRVSMPVAQPSLAPLQTDGGRAPAIQVSSPTGSQENNNYAAFKDGQTRALTPTSQTSPNNSKAPQLPGQPKRHSSLLASRDAELFMALGEVLEKDGQPQRR